MSDENTLPQAQPSGVVTKVDLTRDGLPTGPEPPPVPDGPIRQTRGFTFAYDRTALAFRWVREWNPETRPGRVTVIFAGKSGLTVSGLGPDLDATESSDLIATLKAARQVAIWMMHGERPEYVLEYLDDSDNVDDI